MLSPQMGRLALGAGPVGGPRIYDQGSVTLLPVGTITTGTSFQLDWTFSQPQGLRQDRWRIVWHRDDNSVIFDTGWTEGDQNFYNLIWSNIETPGAGEESGYIKVYAEMREEFGEAPPDEISHSTVIVTELGWPHMTVTAPENNDEITTAQVTVTWEFSDDRVGKTQNAFRIRLYRAGDNFLLHDSGWIFSSAQSLYLVPTNLNHGTRYKLSTRLRNQHGVLSD